MTLERTSQEGVSHEAEINENIKSLGGWYKDRYGAPKSVYYPACGFDATPLVAFPESRIVLLDPNDEGLKAIKKKFPNSTVIHSRAEDFHPDEGFDLLLSMHSHAPFGDEVRCVRPGGRVIIANKMSDYAFDHPDLALVAVATYRYGEGNEGIVGMDYITEGLDKFEEEQENPPAISFGNRRKNPAAYYIFQKKAS